MFIALYFMLFVVTLGLYYDISMSFMIFWFIIDGNLLCFYIFFCNFYHWWIFV